MSGGAPAKTKNQLADESHVNRKIKAREKFRASKRRANEERGEAHERARNGLHGELEKLPLLVIADQAPIYLRYHEAEVAAEAERNKKCKAAEQRYIETLARTSSRR